MILHRGCDVVPDDTGVVCRQSRLGAVICALLLMAAFVSGPVMLWWFDGPMFLLIVNGLLAVFVGLYLIADLRARFRETNWVLWIRPGGLWINLRSYQDRTQLDTLSVLELDDGEIAAVRRRTQRFTISGGAGRFTSRWLESLDIELNPCDMAELKTALTDCRQRRQSGWQVTLHSVSLPASNVIRIAWWGGPSHAVTPKLTRIRELLAYRLPVAESVDEKRSARPEVTEADLDDQILLLLDSGDQIGAIQLLRQNRGMSLGEAKQFVEELSRVRVG